MGEPPQVGVLVPNPFLGVAIEGAVLAAGARVRRLTRAEDATGCVALLADLDALGSDPTPAIGAATARGCTVLTFASGGDATRLAAAGAAGAVALPRSLFLRKLPELLSTLLRREGHG